MIRSIFANYCWAPFICRLSDFFFCIGQINNSLSWPQVFCCSPSSNLQILPKVTWSIVSSLPARHSGQGFPPSDPKPQLAKKIGFLLSTHIFQSTCSTVSSSIPSSFIFVLIPRRLSWSWAYIDFCNISPPPSSSLPSDPFSYPISYFFPPVPSLVLWTTRLFVLRVPYPINFFQLHKLNYKSFVMVLLDSGSHPGRVLFPRLTLSFYSVFPLCVLRCPTLFEPPGFPKGPGRPWDFFLIP